MLLRFIGANTVRADKKIRKKHFFHLFGFAFFKKHSILGNMFLTSLSSRGLGHRVFIPATRVRIPMGMPFFSSSGFALNNSFSPRAHFRMEELFITLAGDDVTKVVCGGKEVRQLQLIISGGMVKLAAKSPGLYQMRHYQFRTHESLQRVEELICKIGKSFRAAPHAGT